jgi:acetyl esterase/lipase
MQMNNRLHINSLVKFVLMATILLSACATPPASTPTLTPATNTPPPVGISLLSKSPELILAVNKPERKTSWPGNVVYTMPETDKVLLASELTYYNDLKIDVYYPPSYNFDAKLPIVILAHGFQETDEYDKDMPSHMDWAKLIAASGMIAVSAQAGSAPVENSYRVLDFLAANADVLGLDLTRIGVWACSGQGGPAFKALQDEKLPYRDAFKVAVFTYLDFNTADPNVWPQNLSQFVVKAGRDQNIPGETIDNFVNQARASKIPTEYIELADAPHAFDVLQNTQASKDTIQQALQFFRDKLLP